jgi:ribonuclease HI
VKLVVNVDGGSRGNPGPAAVGVVVRDESGSVIADAAEPIGTATNNVAEYRELIRGIELAAEHGATSVDLLGDSELVVKQVRGEYRVKDVNLKPLHAEAKSKLSSFSEWSFNHVRREQNAEADALVNQALDAHTTL